MRVRSPIDVHMLHLHRDDKAWMAECIDRMVNEQINIHLIVGQEGNLMNARIGGYSIGRAPYVSYVDPDDLIEPGVFERCYEDLEKDRDLVGVYTQSSIINKDGTIVKEAMQPFREWQYHNMFNSLFEIHQLVVIRREFSDIVNKQMSSHYSIGHPYVEHLRYVLLSKLGPWKALPFVGYIKCNIQCCNFDISFHNIHRCVLDCIINKDNMLIISQHSIFNE